MTEQNTTVKTDDQQMEEVLKRLSNALAPNPEDPEQESLVNVIQESRTFLLKYSMSTYMQNPKNSKLLEGVISLIAGMEKSVRDDRKEQAKKQDKVDDAVSFNQMLEAMKDISSGKIELPTFNIGSFILDPNKPLVSGPDTDPILPGELTQGSTLVDIDGKPV